MNDLVRAPLQPESSIEHALQPIKDQAQHVFEYEVSTQPSDAFVKVCVRLVEPVDALCVLRVIALSTQLFESSQLPRVASIPCGEPCRFTFQETANGEQVLSLFEGHRPDPITGPWNRFYESFTL